MLNVLKLQQNVQNAIIQQKINHFMTILVILPVNYSYTNIIKLFLIK